MTMYLTKTQAAKILGVSRQTIENYRKKGVLVGFQYIDKGKWWFMLADILKFKEGKSQ